MTRRELACGLAGVRVEGGGVADARSYLGAVIAEMEKEWPKNRTVNIVCHGHSVPAGYFRTPEVRTFEAYPHLLHAWLKERYRQAVINVIVTAIGGEDSERGAARFERDVLGHRPDVVLIDYGLNDRGMGLERAREAWTRMVRAAQERGARVLLLTPTGDDRIDMRNPEVSLNQHGTQIRQLAAELEVGLCDSLARYMGHIEGGGELKDLLSQSNHPNRRGHEMVVEEVVKYFGG
jgi:lysophospholipase L1-like esterase